MEEECQAQIKKISELHIAFSERIKHVDTILDVRCIGTILAIELNTAAGTSYFSDVRKEILTYFLKRNILLRPLGNVMYILPPYVIQEEQLGEIYNYIEDFLLELKNKP